jgi:amino acid/amide ABC transporter membrane protein 2, HAAT family (TC 3.A.1.4.-)
MTATDWRNLAVSAALLGLAALLPVYGSPYWLTMGTTMAMFVVLATSWALFSGPTHYISLATAAFFGVGTFVTGLGFQSLPFWVLPPLAAVIGAVLAALVGLVTLRLSGVYFVIFTLGLAEMVRQVVTWVREPDRPPGHVCPDLDHRARDLLDARGPRRAGVPRGLADRPLAAGFRAPHHRQ